MIWVVRVYAKSSENLLVKHKFGDLVRHRHAAETNDGVGFLFKILAKPVSSADKKRNLSLIRDEFGKLFAVKFATRFVKCHAKAV